MIYVADIVLDDVPIGTIDDTHLVAIERGYWDGSHVDPFRVKNDYLKEEHIHRLEWTGFPSSANIPAFVSGTGTLNEIFTCYFIFVGWNHWVFTDIR